MNLYVLYIFQPNFENETDSIRENSDFGLDLEMCDTGTNFKDTVILFYFLFTHKSSFIS